MRKYLGLKEIPGPASDPTITAWIKQSASWLDGDDSKTAWCGCMRGAIGIATGTGAPPAHYRAASWAKWGRAVDITKPSCWQQGDTIVMTRPGGNHVAVLDHVSGKTAFLLGGNQSNAVTIARFDISKITHVRR
jgi:uncharacterized protein (TIGR02594 family)